VAPSGAPFGVLLRRRAALCGGRLREVASALRRVCRHFWQPLRKSCGRPQRPHRQPAPGRQPVLAAGRSPDAARVRGLLAASAGAGPRHTSRRNRFASLMGADKNRDIIL